MDAVARIFSSLNIEGVIEARGEGVVIHINGMTLDAIRLAVDDVLVAFGDL